MLALSRPEDLLLDLVHAVHRRMVECVEPVAREHDLSRMGMIVLRLVQEHAGETVSDLARRSEIAKSHVSNTVELLSQMGFVEKRAYPEDRRLVHLFPTERTRALGEAVLAEVRRSLGDVLQDVSPETLDDLLQGLRTLLDAFDRHHDPSSRGQAALKFQIRR